MYTRIFYRCPHKTLCQASLELGLPSSTVHDILNMIPKLDAYRLQLFQKITHTDLDLRKQFILEMLSCIEEDETYLKRICHCDKKTSHVCGTVNRHNCHVWARKHPHGVSLLCKTSTQLSEEGLILNLTAEHSCEGSSEMFYVCIQQYHGTLYNVEIHFLTRHSASSSDACPNT
jgi:hypothetical protein